MKCLRTLLVAGLLSGRRCSVIKKDLLQMGRTCSLQNSRVVPMRSMQMTKSLGNSHMTIKNRTKQDKESPNQSLVKVEDLFEAISVHEKTKATFQQALDIFHKRDIRRRGHVEFIYAALKKMPEFGVERDIDIYNKILDIFPKKVFVPQNFFQRMFKHYPRQQDCGVQVLEQMEHYGIMPNVETKFLLLQIFGAKSFPVKKYQRIMYWFPKFKHINPYPVPDPLPEDPVDLAKLSLQRVAADLDARVTVYQMPHLETLDSGRIIDHPHIESRALISNHFWLVIILTGPFSLKALFACGSRESVFITMC